MCDYCYGECICPGSRAEREANGETVLTDGIYLPTYTN
jgi:hypothetical protein